MKHINNKTELMLSIESKYGVSIQEILRRLYVDEELTIEQIASKLKINHITCRKFMTLSGIYSRSLS